MPVEALLNQLEKVKRTGASKWLACCPAHDDSDPSLSVTALPDGRILVYCFAGCGAASVVESMGLTLSDLYPDGGLQQHMYGGTPGHRKRKIQQAETLESARLMLRICDRDRAEGKRLSPMDLAKEREAYLMTRGV